MTATAPSSVTISGLQFHPRANVEYDLRPVPYNGRPQYSTADGYHRLFWSPSSTSGSSAVWRIDGVDAELDSPADELPLGSVVWQEANHDRGRYENSRVLLEPSYAPGWCASAVAGLAPILSDVCCSVDDATTCGDGTAPTTCSADCAHLWRPFQEQCGSVGAYLPSTLVEFFDGQCAASIASLMYCRPP